VPQVGETAAYTRFFTQGAIYGMTPMDETTARKLAAYLRAVPVSPYELRSVEPAPSLPAPEDTGAFEIAPAAEGAVSCGEVYEGTVTRVLDFGALVQIAPNVEGLLHISQIAHNRVESVADFLAVGQVVRVKVVETDEKGRVKLSMKALLDKSSMPALADDDFPF
jgi:hypothetical protein